MNAKKICGLLICLSLVTAASADSLELRNGSVIRGKFISRTQSSVTFQVGSSVQSYDVNDVRSIKFDSAAESDASPEVSQHAAEPAFPEKNKAAKPASSITIPAGTQIVVRTIDRIDSTKNHLGDTFQASLEEPLTVDGEVVVPKGADLFGRLEESKTTGTFTGRSELRLALTAIVVNGQSLPLVTGEYELRGKSKGESTAKRTVGGAAIGGIIGAIAAGGKGAAIGAGAGAAAGAGSEIITKGDQVRIPSETLLSFTLQEGVSVPNHQN